MIDDSDEPSRAGTPKPLNDKEDKGIGDSDFADKPSGTQSGQDEAGADKTTATGDAGGKVEAGAASVAAHQELSPEIRQKLRKLEKLEATYPGRCSSPGSYYQETDGIFKNCYDHTGLPTDEPPQSNLSKRPFAKTPL